MQVEHSSETRVVSLINIDSIWFLMEVKDKQQEPRTIGDLLSRGPWSYEVAAQTGVLIFNIPGKALKQQPLTFSAWLHIRNKKLFVSLSPP